ncbi:9801_t:CDS:2, partial [Racocetra persica]
KNICDTNVTNIKNIDYAFFLKQAAKWIKYNGCLPHDAFKVDHRAIGRGQYEGGIHIGYVEPNQHKLIIGWGWNQHELHDFEVLCGDYSQFKWHHSEGACRPQFFIPLKAGHESDGKELYIAKAHYNNEWRIGKAGQC